MAFALHVFQTVTDHNDELSKPHPLREHQQAVNPRTGRAELVFVDLQKVYPNHDAEYSFEELRAKYRGWMDMDWAAIRREEKEKADKAAEAARIKESKPKTMPLAPKEPQEKPAKPKTVPLKGSIEEDLVLNDENTPPSQADADKAKVAKKARREERANRTRKIKVMAVREIRGETQTSRSLE